MAEKLYSDEADREQFINDLVLQGCNYLNKGEIKRANCYFKKALNVNETFIQDPIKKKETEFDLHRYFIKAAMKGNDDDGITYHYKKAEEISNRSGNKLLKAYFYDIRSMLKKRSRSYSDALSDAKTSLAIKLHLQMDLKPEYCKDIADTHYLIACLHIALGHKDEAFSSYQLALKSMVLSEDRFAIENLFYKIARILID